MSRLSQRALAGLALLFNLPFAFFQLQRTAYDTYTHIFFADHYRHAWFSLWEPRWYLGFSVASYPPLVHQLIALLSWPLEAVIRFFAPGPEAYAGAFVGLSEEAAFALLLLAVLALFPLAVRAFAGVFVGPRAAALAGLFAVAVPAVSLAAWSFGQLPTLFATATVLLALARGAAWARTGRRLWLAQAVLLAGVAGAAHHGVFLFVPFAGAAVAWRVLAGPLAWPERRARVARLALWAPLAGGCVVAVLWPFLAWSRGQALQTAIEHASRDNFFASGLAAWFFFWPVYGPLLLLLPAAAWLGLRGRGHKRLPLAALIAVLFTLGLGGTTPLPAVLFGSSWVWLTYDRFALWAALCLLPVAGAVALRLWRRRRRGWVVGLFGALLAWSSVAGWHSVLARAQPPALDLAPLVNFLNAPAQQPYRYFTFGFGDQMARLAALTTNGTPDGDYHTARQLPELRSSGLGALDGAVWNSQGLAALRPFVEQPQRYGVRWAFVAHPQYRALLAASGWRYRFMVGAVEAWEFPGVTPLPIPTPAGATGPAAVWWGSAPLVMLALALALAATCPSFFGMAAERRWPALTRAHWLTALAGARQAAWALAVGLLLFWWYHLFWQGPAPEVYFLYQSVVVFASDLAALAALGLWLIELRLQGVRPRLGPRALLLAGLALLAFAALSVPFSSGPQAGAAVVAQLLLLLGWYLLCVNAAPPAATLGRVLGALLLLQAIVVVGQAIAQQNDWLAALGLAWPPRVRPEYGGAPVIENAAGALWMRVYGTLPHPNVLAGALLVLAAGVSERYLVTGRRRWLTVAALAGAALLLAFSRAAWVGAGVMAVIGLLWSGRYHPAVGPRFRRLVLALGLAAAAAALPLLPWLLARVTVGDTATTIETRSVYERVTLTADSLALIWSHPLVGVGAGHFAVANMATGSQSAAEPVHNLLLLITAETGLGGGAAALALAGAVGRRLWQRRRRAEVAEAMWGLALLGVLVTGLFDHYWWSLAPARMLFVTALGLWVGAGERASGLQVALGGEVALDARGEALGGFQPDAHVVGVEQRV